MKHPRRLPKQTQPRKHLRIVLSQELYDKVTALAEELAITRSYAASVLLTIGAEHAQHTMKAKAETTGETDP
jgi:hypothetical protein